MKKIIRTILIVGAIFASLYIVFNATPKNKEDYTISYTRFIKMVDNDGIFKARLDGNKLWALAKTGEEFNIYVPNDQKLIDDLLSHQVDLNVAAPKERSIWWDIFIAIFPIFLLLGFWIYFIRKQSPDGKFGKSNAKLLIKDEYNEVLFDDVAGCDEAKEEVREIVDFLQNPEKFSRLGGRIPKGILLTGEPGTGKTMLAKAIAHEAGVPFYSISGSDFVEMFVGVGASRVRDMFAQAKKNSPCIIFIDEIDAIGKSRGSFVVGNDERDQTLNALLVEMDGFSCDTTVIIIAATNRPEVLDSALLRPGRFDRQVSLCLPDLIGREQILSVHTDCIPLDEDVCINSLARGTTGFSGAELANLVNEAIIFATRENLDTVTMNAFENAKDKMLMGVEKKSLIMTEEERIMTAYHEAGHAIVGYLMPEHDPIYKISIIPRGKALGITMFLPENDQTSMSKRKLEGEIATLYAGRIAEELYKGKNAITTGASNDIERATYIASKMILDWGMSNKLPILKFTEEDYYGNNNPKPYSETLSSQIEKEIITLSQTNYKKAYSILKQNWKNVEILVNELLKHETISGEFLDTLFRSNK